MASQTDNFKDEIWVLQRKWKTFHGTEGLKTTVFATIQGLIAHWHTYYAPSLTTKKSGTLMHIEHIKDLHDSYTEGLLISVWKPTGQYEIVNTDETPMTNGEILQLLKEQKTHA